MDRREQYPYTWAMLDLFDSVEPKLKPIREEFSKELENLSTEFLEIIATCNCANS